MKKSLAAFFILWLSFCLLANAQKSITGIVVDSSNFVPLPYVNIQIKHTTKGTSSDPSGKFKIIAYESDTLVFSYIGYHTFEMALYNWDPSVIIMAESITVLNTVVIKGSSPEDNYELLFSEQIKQLAKSNRKLPFYFSQGKKEKIKLYRFEDEKDRVQTYVGVVINNPNTKALLMKRNQLSEPDYYAMLTRFNEKYYRVMYYLTAAELLSLLNRFFGAGQ